MVDPLSFTASLAALVGVAGTSLKASMFLYDFCKRVKGAEEEIEKFALDVQNFGSLVHMGHKCLERYSAKAPRSLLMENLKELQMVASLAKQAIDTEKRIKRARKQVEDVKSRSKKWTRVRWVFTTSEVERLHPEMEKIKSGLNLVINCVNFEIAQSRGDSEETRQEM